MGPCALALSRVVFASGLTVGGSVGPIRWGGKRELALHYRIEYVVNIILRGIEGGCQLDGRYIFEILSKILPTKEIGQSIAFIS